MINFFKKITKNKNSLSKNNKEDKKGRFFLKDLEEVITKEKKTPEQEKSNKLIINVDKFMEFNMEFGFDAGNLLLDELKQRILNYFTNSIKNEYNEFNNDSKKIYHLSSDSLLIELKEYETDLSFIKGLIKELEYPYNINNKKVYIKTRVAISSNKYELFENVLYATKFARQKGKNIVYTSEINDEKQKIKEKFKIFGILKESFEEDAIIAYYQPIIDKNNNINHYEVLIRIQKDGNIIMPGQFLSVAKEFRLYLPLSQRIINKAIYLYKEKNIPFSVNIDMEDLESKSFRKKIFSIIDENFKDEIDREKFHIEISLSRALLKEGDVFFFLKKLKEQGIKIILDDFGKGFNNIEMLYNLEDIVWGVKYSGVLIKNIDKDPLKQKILQHLNAALKTMNISTIAKFVENKEIKDFLINANIDYFQGYYCSTPQDLSC